MASLEKPADVIFLHRQNKVSTEHENNYIGNSLTGVCLWWTSLTWGRAVSKAWPAIQVIAFDIAPAVLQ
jgi:hypothetical protein